jgi:predicted aspartyl protease
MKTPQQTFELAKQGDPAAIAYLLTQSLKSTVLMTGITVRATRRGTCLRVLLESEQIPDPQSCLPVLQNHLDKLQAASIATIEVYGKQTCATTPAWNQTLKLENIPAENLPAVPPLPAPSASAPNVTQPLAIHRSLAPTRRPFNQTHQLFFTGVMALILVLLGANLNAIVGSLSRSQTQKRAAMAQTDELIHRAPIVSRWKGVPVIQVTFNEAQTFPMVMDTGAAGTLITPSMASTLRVQSVGQMRAHTANGPVVLDVGYVRSIEVDGAKLEQVPVAIGLPDLSVGLLGHDFFGKYDVTVRETVVEFRVRS